MTGHVPSQAKQFIFLTKRIGAIMKQMAEGRIYSQNSELGCNFWTISSAWSRFLELIVSSGNRSSIMREMVAGKKEEQGGAQQ